MFAKHIHYQTNNVTSHSSLEVFARFIGTNDFINLCHMNYQLHSTQNGLLIMQFKKKLNAIFENYFPANHCLLIKQPLITSYRNT